MFQKGQQIGVYTLISLLGRGGFGEVWLAERRSKFVTTKVAVKLPHDGQVDPEAIEQEARLWEKASGHPNVLPIIEAHEYDGQIVIVSEYAPDGSLEEWLRKNGNMTAEKAVEMTIKILDGLEFLHLKNIIHRDLKPANLLLRDETPLLADFGISRALRSTLSSRSGNISGTFAYMPPEGFDGKRSIQTDIWAVGVNLYRFLTGRLPFPQTEPSMLIPAIMLRDFEPLPRDLPGSLRNIVAKALEKQPENRYKTAAEMREDLRQILRKGLILPVPVPDIAQPVPPSPPDFSTVETVVKDRGPNLTGESGQPRYPGNYVLPSPDLLIPAPPPFESKDEELLLVAQEITDKFNGFNVTGRVTHISQGPVITTYEYQPDLGVKYSRITSLLDDLSLTLKSEAIRIALIPDKNRVGIEVPNSHRETIFLRDIIESNKFRESSSPLTLALGKTNDGLNVVMDLTQLSHLLILGTTGTGKSTLIHSLILSILYKASPDQVKLILIDPKRLELGFYADIPHLATPIITEAKRAAIALKWAVAEMERRYRDLAGRGIRNIEGFNRKIKTLNDERRFDDKGKPWTTLPYIVIIIDELTNLMTNSEKEWEESISRLAQMGHIAGINVIVTTQRLTSTSISKLTRESFPSRISFRVVSKADSRAIFNADGAEQLLGKGDMLFLPQNTNDPIRIQGAAINESEIYGVAEYLKAQGSPDYHKDTPGSEDDISDLEDLPGKKDPLFRDAVRSIVHAKRASTSILQRHLRIGYGRAAAILDAMVREGYVGDMDGSTRARPVLQKAYEDLSDIEDMGSY